MVKKREEMGLMLINGILYALQFADDQIFIVQSKEGLQYTIRKVKEEYKNGTLPTIIAKIKYIWMGEEITDLNWIMIF